MVADTSVLIDLERGSLLEQCFPLPFEFKVPDLLYRNELASRAEGQGFGESLIRLGLEVVELNGTEVERAILHIREDRRLSLADSFALALAESKRWTLLTGDGILREMAQVLNVPCHGVLWILDEIHREGIASPSKLVSGLSAIRDHPRCRLPRVEVDARIRRYSAPFRD